MMNTRRDEIKASLRIWGGDRGVIVAVGDQGHISVLILPGEQLNRLQ